MTRANDRQTIQSQTGWVGPTWIVGASTGIGAALAQAIGPLADLLILSARNQSALAQVAQKIPTETQILPFDITDSQATAAACAQLKDTEISMVILNAGTCEYMDSAHLDLALLNRVMQTNFFAMVSLIDQALPLLQTPIKSGATRAKLVIMSSSVTYQALPRAHAYGASKAALRYFAECLKIDLQREGIDVHLISPGFVKTPLTDKNDFDMPFLISAEAAAQAIITGLRANKFDISFPKPFIWILKSVAKLPDKLAFKLLAHLSRHQKP